MTTDTPTPATAQPDAPLPVSSDPVSDGSTEPLAPPTEARAGAAPNKLGLIGLILAIVGLVLAVIPFVAGVAWLLTLPALILGIIGLTRKGQKKLTSILAVVISTIAWIVAVVVASASFLLTVGNAVQDEVDRGPDVVAEEPAAPAEEPAAPPAEEPTEGDVLAAGDSFLADMGNGDVAKITIVEAGYSTDPMGEGFLETAPENGGFLVLDVLWETESGETHANPLYLSARDAEGREGDLNLFAEGLMGDGQVPQGDRMRGVVAFDIGSGPYTIVVSTELFQEAGRATIDVR